MLLNKTIEIMKRIIFAVLLLSSCLGLGAQQLQSVPARQQAQMFQTINAAASKITSITSSFTQVKTISFLNDKVRSTGNLYFTNQQQLRWEYISPYQYTFIINGEKVHIKNGKRSQTIDVKSSQMFKSIARMMMNSITGRNLMDNRDFTSQLYLRGREWVAIMTPRRSQIKKMFKSVTLYFNEQHSMVSRVVMTEPSGDTTVITLSNVKINATIPEQIFVGR